MSDWSNMDDGGTPESDRRFAATVKVGPKGQIVIPKEARAMFDIEPGDTLLLLADATQGIAILRQDLFQEFIDHAMPSTPQQGS